MVQKFDYVKEIWDVADLIRGPIKTSEYNRVILPFTMLRRLECALEPTRGAVIKAVEEHGSKWGREDFRYNIYSKQAFYNITGITLATIGPLETLKNLNLYIDGFSENARSIMQRFKMKETCAVLEEHGMLHGVCRKFATFDLSPAAVSDREMTDIYEHLIQRFGESISENAEDFMTPKDVVHLAVEMAFTGERMRESGHGRNLKTIYDPTMGTGGFISDALNYLEETGSGSTEFIPYGQEYERESWAMSKAAMMLRSRTDEAGNIVDMSSNIAYGDTLSNDCYTGKSFDYIFANPPYGKRWDIEKESVEAEATLGFNGRFGAGLPDIEDGSMLFLQHIVNKMKPESEGGSKACVVLSASPLSVGATVPGSGPSNIRRWLFEKDVIDCIVKLPMEIFFRTKISTYLWCLSTKKPEERKGRIQLIDASEMKMPLRKSQGNKRFKISGKSREWIVDTYLKGQTGDRSVIVPYEEFMFRKVITQRPLRAALVFSEEKLTNLLNCPELEGLSEKSRGVLAGYMKGLAGKRIAAVSEAKSIAKAAADIMDDPEVRTSVLAKAIRSVYTERGEGFPVVCKRNGAPMPDPDLKGSESVPFGKEIDTYMASEVLPYMPDTWIDESVVDNKGPLQDGMVGIVGTNISFNRYFYHYTELRDPAEIAGEIMDLETGIEALVRGLFHA